MPDKKNYMGCVNPISAEWENSPWTELLKERYRIASLFCKDKTVLDTCCGTGWGTIQFISPVASQVLGLDLEDQSKNRNHLPANCRFLAMDAVNIELGNASYDTILALDSIEHFSSEDGIKYLQGISQVMKEDGLLIGTTPLVPDKSLIPTFLKWNKYHIYVYTREALDQALRKVFPFVHIFEIYHPVCPFFVFLCWKSKNTNMEAKEALIETYIKEHKRQLEKGKLLANIRWAKSLLGRGYIIKGIKLFLNFGS